MKDSRVITAVGAVTAVGASAAQTCASVRGGLSGLRRHPAFYAKLPAPVQDEPERVTCGGVLDLAIRSRAERLMQLSVSALRDLVTHAGMGRAQTQTTEIIVCTPERDAVDAMEFAHELSRRLGMPLRVRVLTCEPSMVLQQLVFDAERFIVVGVDSLVDDGSLRWLDERDRLRSQRTADGLIAGEGAACVLLETEAAARKRGATAMARLRGVGRGEEPNPITGEANSTARGLCGAIREAAASRHEPIAWAVSDLTGETYGAYEWGLARARLSDLLGKAQLAHPADAMGVIGVAAPILALVIAARALANGHAPSDHALVFCGADGAARTACVLEAVKAS